MDRLRRFFANLNRDIFIGDRLERNLLSLSREAVIMVMLGLVMFLVNLANGDLLVSLSPLVFLIAQIVVFCLARFRKNRKAAVVMSAVSIVVVLTVDVLFVDNRFAFLWTLLIPLSTCYLFGLKPGICLMLYFQVLFTAFFWTPLRSVVEGHFSEIVMARFPLLYFFNALITIFVMYDYQCSVLAQLDYNERLNAEVTRQTRYAVERANKLERFSDEMVETLAKAIDAKDRYTNGHSFRVSGYAVAIARELGWDEAEVDALRRESLLHDIGKIGVPDAVLNKPGKLTGVEYATIQSHAEIGETILRGMEGLDGAAQVAKCHHERYDGHGYPAGLSGQAIPPHARVVAIADAYDAMHSDRTYRLRLSDRAIREELERERGRQFDPIYLDAFLELLDSGELNSPEERRKEA